MFRVNKLMLLKSAILLILMVGCTQAKHIFKKVNNPENYQAKYKANGGYIPTLFFNENKVINETQFMAALAVLKKAREDGGKIKNRQRSNRQADSTEVIVDIVSNAIQSEIDGLYKELEKLDPLDDNSHKTILEVLAKVNDLYYKKINPYKILKNKSVNTLFSDLSFKTGESELKQEGLKEIRVFVRNIEDDIIDWKAYVDDHNNQIFANDRFKITVQINGYADKQGSKENNLKLSATRAEEVREAFIGELKKISKKYSIVYSVNFDGKGEELPPGVEDNSQQNDQKRRVCIITSVIGPMKLITAK